MNFNEFAPPIEYHKELNPKIWDQDRLRSEVRGALLRIAEDFLEFVDVPVDVADIVITGGNVNYNYTGKSDIDLHIIANYDNIECDREADELFDTKRLLYKQQYDLSIHSIPVELYVEDHRHPAVSLGVYSVLDDAWRNKPSADLPQYDEEELEHWVSIWHTILKHAMKTGDLQTCRTSVKLLRDYRKKGLKTPAGEFSIPNLVYKSLRNDDTVKAITTLIDRLHDQSLSVPQQ